MQIIDHSGEIKKKSVFCHASKTNKLISSLFYVYGNK